MVRRLRRWWTRLILVPGLAEDGKSNGAEADIVLLLVLVCNDFITRFSIEFYYLGA